MTWIAAAGLFNLSLALFHLTFWRLLNWSQELPKLSPTNRAVMQALNLTLTFCFFLAALLYLAHPGDLAATGIGRLLAWGMFGLWVTRVVQQVFLFDLHRRAHQVVLVVLLLGAILHGLVLIS